MIDKRKTIVFQILLNLLVVGGLISFTVWYVAQNARRWCDLMQPLDKRYQALQTQDPAAIEFRQHLHELVMTLNCP